jgi:hypothetical protein
MTSKPRRADGVTVRKETIKKLLKSYYIKSISQDNLDGTLNKSKLNSSLLSARSMKKLNTQFPGFNPLDPLVEKPNENAVDSFQSFIKDCFDDVGKPKIKSYLKNVGEKSCKWCPYKDDLRSL